MSHTPSQRRERARQIAERLERAESIAVATHVGGDGDGWGSAIALAHHFAPAGTSVRLLAASPLPQRFRFLLPPASEPFGPDEQGFEALRSAELQIVVDASEPGRLGDFAPHYRPERTVVIDHHAVVTRRMPAALTLIEPDAAATAELIYEVLQATGTALSAGTARALYVGLVTDTGSFRYSNSSPQAHRVAAALIEAGADPEELYRPLFANLRPGDLATMRAALEGLMQDEELGLAWTVLGADVARRHGALEEYEDVLELLRNLRGTEVAVLVRQLESGEVKLSLRSTGPADVAAIARAFGGGGHQKAAGATLKGDLQAVTEQVLAACRARLESARRRHP